MVSIAIRCINLYLRIGAMSNVDVEFDVKSEVQIQSNQIFALVYCVENFMVFVDHSQYLIRIFSTFDDSFSLSTISYPVHHNLNDCSYEAKITHTLIHDREIILETVAFVVFWID